MLVMVYGLKNEAYSVCEENNFYSLPFGQAEASIY